MTVSGLKDLLTNTPFDKYYDEILKFAKNTIKLNLESRTDGEIDIGTSKFGGMPDLPDSIKWPFYTKITKTEEKQLIFFKKEIEVRKDLPLSFLAQINLKEVSVFDTDDLLPKQGILYFFCESDEIAYTPKESYHDKFKVFYFDGDIAELKRISFPERLDEALAFKPCIVKPSQEISIPYEETNTLVYEEFVKIFDEESDEFDDFIDLISDNHRAQGAINKIFGYADNIQGDSIAYCCESDLNSKPNNIFPESDEAYAAIAKWKLLLQIDSNDECNMCWGDLGRVFFCIKEDDLKNRDFTKTWFIIEYY